MMEDIIKAMKALSDETRLRILNVVLQRECCVCEVMQALDISESRASRNLGLLQDAGFLKAKRDGIWTVYSLDREGMRDYLPGLVKAVGQALADSTTAAEDRERLKKAQRVGTCCVKKLQGGNA
jgi:ArsR family transcriptional regulator, arsenate/arsenite/antimonite-responsive transcriptional repressor